MLREFTWSDFCFHFDFLLRDFLSRDSIFVLFANDRGVAVLAVTDICGLLLSKQPLCPLTLTARCRIDVVSSQYEKHDWYPSIL